MLVSYYLDCDQSEVVSHDITYLDLAASRQQNITDAYRSVRNPEILMDVSYAFENLNLINMPT